jgi:peptidoglycan pentaglycine glycine transferase (the first glycine)
MEYGDKAWVLYAGNHNIITNSYSNYKTYNEHIKYCYDNGIKMYDQFGTIGDLDPNNPRFGLHDFKKKFGGDYVEFIGEFDLITNKAMYFAFNKLVPIYRNMNRSRAKKNIEKNLKK